MLPWKPKVVYGPTTLAFAQPQEPPTPASSAVGGSETSAAGVVAAFVVRRDQFLDMRLRFAEWEWPSVLTWLEYGQAGGVFQMFPSTVPPETQNILGPDAATTYSGSGVLRRYLDKAPLSTLGLSVGDVVSFSGDAHVSSAGSDDSSGFAILFWDAADGIVAPTYTGYSPLTAYSRIAIQGIPVPSGATKITVEAYGNEGADGVHSAIKYARRAMLNTGAIAQPYADPSPPSYECRLASPAMGEEIRPERHTYPGLYTISVRVRRTSGGPFDVRYFGGGPS